uniref:Uncharacterized protein n=1 Tax=Cucumis melo TaxID=3656 RepID=A0A9I9CGJ2_CUCME
MDEDHDDNTTHDNLDKDDDHHINEDPTTETQEEHVIIDEG